MKSRIPAVLIALTVLFLATVPTAEAQRRMTVDEVLGALNPGQWLELEGVPQRDKSVLCAEVKMLTGDFHDDDWTLSGNVQRVNAEKRQVVVLGLTVQIPEDAEFESDVAKFRSFDDLKVGMFLEVEGTYLKDGTFLAKELEQEEADVDSAIEVQGRVESVDPSKRTITLMGLTFKLTERTQAKSAIK